MPIDIDRALGIHPQALLLRSQRAEVLAANLANADTPNYKARDIDFNSMLNRLREETTSSSASAGQLHTTQSGHLSSQASVSQAELLYRNPTQASLDGNTVDSQVEYAEFARNALEYQATLRFLDGRIKSLMTAIRGE